MKSFKLLILEFAIGICSLFCYTSCQKKAQNDETILSKKDTIAIIETALADHELNSIFYRSFPGKNLKIVSNEFVSPDYEIAFKGKHVPIVSYDSTLHNPTFTPFQLVFSEKSFISNHNQINKSMFIYYFAVLAKPLILMLQNPMTNGR